VQQLGFAGGRVLEAGCGSGNFIGFAPRGAPVRAWNWTLSPPSIAAKLYPDATSPASRSPHPRPEGSFDLAIGNVPFGNFALTDGRHNPGGTASTTTSSSRACTVRPGGWSPW